MEDPNGGSRKRGRLHRRASTASARPLPVPAREAPYRSPLVFRHRHLSREEIFIAFRQVNRQFFSWKNILRRWARFIRLQTVDGKMAAYLLKTSGDHGHLLPAVAIPAAPCTGAHLHRIRIRPRNRGGGWAADVAERRCRWVRIPLPRDVRMQPGSARTEIAAKDADPPPPHTRPLPGDIHFFCLGGWMLIRHPHHDPELHSS